MLPPTFHIPRTLPGSHSLPFTLPRLHASTHLPSSYTPTHSHSRSHPPFTPFPAPPDTLSQQNRQSHLYFPFTYSASPKPYPLGILRNPPSILLCISKFPIAFPYCLSDMLANPPWLLFESCDLFLPPPKLSSPPPTQPWLYLHIVHYQFSLPSFLTSDCSLC